MKLPYNQTQLHPEQTFERRVFHRDQFAHYLRWTRVLNLAQIGMKILDVGCGNANLLEVFYRNRFKPARYLGIDTRKQTMNKNRKSWAERLDFAEFTTIDVVKHEPPKDDWDIITCFEVLEHIGKNNAIDFLRNIKSAMTSKTLFLLSTPVFDQKTGAANNHIIQGEVGEFEFNELKDILMELFTIEQVNGTFSSKRDIYKALTAEERMVYDNLCGYYDSNLMSVIFAPLHPEQSRNCIWTLRKKSNDDVSQ